jgi:cobalt-zinc-cadmium efflux system protein
MHNHENKRSENIKVVVALNIFFTVVEVVGGLLTNSLTILSDALHDFGDSVTLISSYVLEKKSQKEPDQRRTFGYQRLSLLSAIFAGIVLTGGSLFILSRAIPRLINPEHVNAQGMILLAVLGVVVNGAGALRLKRGASMNEKVLTWHLLEDVLGWVVVLIGSIIILFWDSHIVDPIMTIGYTVFILWGVGKNLKETLNIFLQGVPGHIDINHIKEGLMKTKGVLGVHDIHVWSLEGETDIFTGHIVVDESLLKDTDKTRKVIKDELSNHHIEHSTIELETKEYCSGIECNNGYHGI